MSIIKIEKKIITSEVKKCTVKGIKLKLKKRKQN